MAEILASKKYVSVPNRPTWLLYVVFVHNVMRIASGAKKDVIEDLFKEFGKIYMRECVFGDFRKTYFWVHLLGEPVGSPNNRIMSF